MSFKRKGFKKNSKTEDIIGCSFQALVEHIEDQFMDGMAWENQGKWHIDHFFPIAMAKNKEQAYMLSNYINLRPLWAGDNVFKSGRMPYDFCRETGKITPVLECDLKYIVDNFERLECVRKFLLES